MISPRGALPRRNTEPLFIDFFVNNLLMTADESLASNAYRVRVYVNAEPVVTTSTWHALALYGAVPEVRSRRGRRGRGRQRLTRGRAGRQQRAGALCAGEPGRGGGAAAVVQQRGADSHAGGGGG